MRFTRLVTIGIANLFQLFVMPPDAFVQRLVNYSTSCRLIRELITTGRQLRWLGEFEKPITVIAYVVFIRERMRNPMCRTVKQSMTWRLFKAGEGDDEICPIRSIAGETG